MTAIIIAVAIVSAVALAALAYGGPKYYWYKAQIKLLSRAADAEQQLIDIHVADHTTDVAEKKIDTDPGLYL